MTAIPHWRIVDARNDGPVPDDIQWSSVWWDGEGLRIRVDDNPGRPLFRMEFDRGATFDVAPADRLIRAFKHKDGVAPRIIADLLADQVEPRVLAYEGAFIVHASAIEVNGFIVLFVGDSGFGKSTLAASFDQSGTPMLCDDAVIVEWVDGRVTGRAVYPSLRLHPDSLEALIPGIAAADAVAYHGDKRRLNLPFQDRGTDAARPVAAIFSLDAVAATKDIAIQSLSPAALCMALVTNSFSLDPTDLAAASRKLGDAGQVAEHVPAFSLDYPRDFALLPAVRAAIVDQVRQSIVEDA